MKKCYIESETKNGTVYLNIQADCNLVIKVNDDEPIVVKNTVCAEKREPEVSIGKRVAKFTAKPTVVKRAKLDSKKYSPTPVIRLININNKKSEAMKITSDTVKTDSSNKDIDTKSNLSSITNNFNNGGLK